MFRVAVSVLALAAAGAASAQSGPPSPAGVRRTSSIIPGAVSKNAPINGVLTLYGNERCPTNKEGDEIVICVRRSAEEQFRIPKEIREFEVTPENASWAVKEAQTREVGNVGIGSCTTVGPGGGMGCFNQQARAAKAENKARAKAEQIDLP